MHADEGQTAEGSGGGFKVMEKVIDRVERACDGSDEGKKTIKSENKNKTGSARSPESDLHQWHDHDH